ncbi:peptidase M23 [Streptomyces sp. Ru73]|uniref:M23 family metallopeptidase n=1 Tax=Streptomyces sp. Ru73 TaxID=2080748 RepID=UPI000CDD76F1|nr:M23 family metallopeptidase [Streptomyces sp. Ru73]POX40276.1 peptidase M23 [Streptomyces sp. Ru73]
MNDRHPSGNQDPTGSAADASYGSHPGYEPHGQQDAQLGYPAYDGYTTGAYDTGAYASGAYDPTLYEASAYDTGSYGTVAYDGGTTQGGGAYDSGSYDLSGAYDPNAMHDTGTYATGYGTGSYDPYAYGAYDSTGTYDTGSYDLGGAQDTGAYDVTGAYDTTGGYETAGSYEPSGAYDGYGQQDPGAATGQWDSSAWSGAEGHEAAYQGAEFEAGLEAGAGAGQGATHFGTGPFDSGQFDTGQFESGQFDAGHVTTGQFDTETFDAGQFETAQFEPPHFEADAESTAVFPADELAAAGHDGTPADGGAPDDDIHSAATAIIPTPTLSPEGAPGGRAGAASGGRRAARREAHGSGGGRGRRRPAKKSALLTVAVPSVAAMGVCAVAAASVSGATDKDEDTAVQAASDASAVKPSAANNKLDSQLSNLSADANDFADRASRTQERLDLQARAAAEKKRKAEEAARKEALRPKFALPVKQHGLSALFGQAGVNWMSLHSGIDFPVSYGTPVMAATDGTVVTKWNPAYGNMVEITAPDGTETWYCHLSSAKIRSGTVKAGDVIAYSGNSGNSTGPHLHFEVHPGGGDAIDPLPWLRSKGLDPN